MGEGGKEHSSQPRMLHVVSGASLHIQSSGIGGSQAMNGPWSLSGTAHAHVPSNLLSAKPSIDSESKVGVRFLFLISPSN